MMLPMPNRKCVSALRPFNKTTCCLVPLIRALSLTGTFISWMRFEPCNAIECYNAEDATCSSFACHETIIIRFVKQRTYPREI